MMQHLATADISMIPTGSYLEFDLCYRRNPPFRGYNRLPTVTLHFEGNVALVLQPDIAFMVQQQNGRELICMLIGRGFDNDQAIIGAQTQANHVFLFDVRAKRLY
ncbi:hypothetical protein QQ045_029853 [Rhodiola kirilowii]